MFVLIQYLFLFVAAVLLWPLHVCIKLFKWLFGIAPRRPCKKILFVCFGSPNLLIDAVGPVVGTRLCNEVLQRYPNISIDVIGTLAEPLIPASMHRLAGVHNKNYDKIIAVDASLYRDDTRNKIIFENNGVCPGAAVGHKSQCIGDVCFLAAMGNDIHRNVSTAEVTTLSSKMIREIEMYLNSI